jgi:hypothetical protein
VGQLQRTFARLSDQARSALLLRVLARATVVPQVPAHRVHACDPAHAPERAKPRVKGQDACLVAAEQPRPNPSPVPNGARVHACRPATRYPPWAGLLKRLYGIDALRCAE